MEEATIEEDVQRMKRTAREIMGKNSVRITHALGNKTSLYFGLIVLLTVVIECKRIGIPTCRLTE